MSELDDLKKEAVERIYLIPDRDDGRLRYVWCDDPSPEYGMRDDDAVEYVRRDKYDALAAHVEEGQRLVRELLVYDVTDDATPLTEWCELETPATSLARLKAEVLEEARGKHTGNRCYCAARIGKAASELRRRAGGGDPT